MGNRLSDLNKGATGVIGAIDRPDLEIALMKVGLVRGDRFLLSDRAPFGGPIALLVNGHKVALRRSDAALISIDPLP